MKKDLVYACKYHKHETKLTDYVLFLIENCHTENEVAVIIFLAINLGSE